MIQNFKTALMSDKPQMFISLPSAPEDGLSENPLCARPRV